MAEVSDFDIAAGSTFLFGSRPLNTTFFAGGRNRDKRIYIQISGLGGYSAGRSAIRMRATINGTTVGSFYFRRWTDHSFIVFDHTFLDFSSNILNSFGPNTLHIEPHYVGSADYCWVGPVVVHFRQNT
ncbi:hypothetical protein ACXYMU_15900 [Pontibacter sp. CAU 1760]